MQTHKLYRRWQAVADAHPDDLALHDFGGGQGWSFAEVAAEVERRPRAGRYVAASGLSVELVFETLRGWRDGAIVCPLDGECPSAEWFEQIPEGIAHVKLSPGSWPTLRAILMTAEQLEADADQIVAAMGLRSDWPNASAISMAHSYGFSNLVLPLLLHGVPLIWMGDPFPNTVQEVLAQLGPVTLAAVPVLWRTWHQSGVIDPEKVKLAISAGASLPLALEREVYEQCGVKIHNFYGASECGGIAYDETDQPRNDDALAGTLLPGVSLESTEAGIAIQSPAVAEALLSADGKLRSLQGTCSLEEEGKMDGQSFTLSQPRRDLINVAGRKVMPQTVERELENLDGVEFAIVLGVQSRDPFRNEQVTACVLTGECRDLNPIRAQLRLTLQSYEVPARIMSWKEMTTAQPSECSRNEWRRKFREALMNHAGPSNLKVSN